MASTEPEAMQVAVLHMNGGNEESSYANNSFFQETSIRKVQPILKEIIRGIASRDGFPKCFNIADLGCSSGPNTLLVVSNIIDEVHEVCKEKNLKVPEFQVHLNDLYGNDFNSIFKSLPMFYAKLKKEKGENFSRVYFSAVPGSFHERLFPDRTIHLFHSSTSLHWLSQVPKGIENNKLNIYMAKTSPPNIFEMYRMQFRKDFTMFLESRSTEIIDGGHMALTFPGRSIVSPISNDTGLISEMLAKSLVEMAKEGLVQESKIHSFNMPCYNSHMDELRDIIDNQGSFSINTFESFEVNLDPYDTDYENVKVSANQNHGKRATKIIRAAIEPMFVAHFGISAMDLLFEKFEKKMDEQLATEKFRYFNMVISLTKISKVSV